MIAVVLLLIALLAAPVPAQVVGCQNGTEGQWMRVYGEAHPGGFLNAYLAYSPGASGAVVAWSLANLNPPVPLFDAKLLVDLSPGALLFIDLMTPISTPDRDFGKLRRIPENPHLSGLTLFVQCLIVTLSGELKLTYGWQVLIE